MYLKVFQNPFLEGGVLHTLSACWRFQHASGLSMLLPFKSHPVDKEIYWALELHRSSWIIVLFLADTWYQSQIFGKGSTWRVFHKPTVDSKTWGALWMWMWCGGTCRAEGTSKHGLNQRLHPMMPHGSDGAR